jgi:ABC-type lipoprotein release transport system permease subunit
MTLAAVIAGVAGITAAAFLARNVDQLQDDPSRWGWTWSSMPDHYAPDRTDAVFEAVADDDRIDAVADIAANGVLADGTVRSAFAIVPRVGELDFAVRTGRLPRTVDEVAIGARTSSDLDIDIGDALAVSDLTGARQLSLTVVGTAVIPYDSAGTIDDGLVLTPDALTAVTTPGTRPALTHHLTYADGVDVARLEADLAEDFGLEFNLFTAPRLPGTIANTTSTRQIAIAVGIFVGGLGLVAMAHALASSARQRRREVAVMVALGLPRSGVLDIVLAHALTLGVCGVAMGVPLGLGIGRLVWDLTTGDLGALTAATMPVLWVLVIAAVAMAMAAVVAWPNARRGSSRAPSVDLRAE